MNPILTLALVALTVRYGLPLVTSSFDEGVVRWLWSGISFVLTPFSFVATWVDPYFSPISESVDTVGTAVLGLIPYIFIDAAYRRLIWRRF